MKKADFWKHIELSKRSDPEEHEERLVKRLSWSYCTKTFQPGSDENCGPSGITIGRISMQNNTKSQNVILRPPRVYSWGNQFGS
jgi:hypothetical protein